MFLRAILAFILFFVFVALVIVGGFYIAISPKNFAEAVDVEIARGSTLNSAAKTLKEANVIRSAFAFQNLVLMQGNERGIVAGVYRFSEPQSSRRIAERLMFGEFDSDSQKVTFPEGSTVEDMGNILAKKITNFSRDEFLAEATQFEGFLFPDTYFFHSDVTPSEVILRLRETFSDKTENLSIDKKLADQPLSDIIIMASILEGEASEFEARRIVSGILWERLAQDIPLQVDAAFLYIDELEGRNTYSLTKDDLAIDSPYNTYTNKGLPPTPITNPGIESIMAAANPILSDYLFYLSDTKGNMYYAKTFEEHIENREFLDF